MTIRNCLSKIFQPISIIPKNAVIKNHDLTSKSQKLMLELGLIQQSTPGCFNLLPICIRSLEKLTKIVDEEMHRIGGQKIQLPAFINDKLWEKTGRLENPELFQLKDRHNHNYVLSPTHEESVSDLLSRLTTQSYKEYPLKLYQITNKFRDEMKPRFGLIRSRQFLMKDMYSFDIDIKSAQKTYEEVCDSYDRFFKHLGIDFVKVHGSPGVMGGNISHEYHFKAAIGEDRIFTCNNCNWSTNFELLNDLEVCPKCSNNGKISTGIEVAHTFLLGEKYSKPLNAKFLSQSGKLGILQMGSYGIGLTRILAGALEVNSDDQQLRWPDVLAPFQVVLIPPKSGSKEETDVTISLTNRLYSVLDEIFRGDVLLDDRKSLTIGRRCLDARRMGYRYVVVIGQKALETIPHFELNDIRTNQRCYLNETDLLQYLVKKEELNNLNGIKICNHC